MVWAPKSVKKQSAQSIGPLEAHFRHINHVQILTILHGCNAARGLDGANLRQTLKIMMQCSNLCQAHPKTMIPNTAKEVYILGLTKAGKPFRPSDWAERLAGVMSQFGEVKCVVVQREMRDFNVMAWDFCINFARDNDLQVQLTVPT
jgi:Protein of unknown function (DUF3579)